VPPITPSAPAAAAPPATCRKNERRLSLRVGVMAIPPPLNRPIFRRFRAQRKPLAQPSGVPRRCQASSAASGIAMTMAADAAPFA